MSSQVSKTIAGGPGRQLNARQRETLERLLVAGEQELWEMGVEGLTVRTVAQRAAVSPATAYTYLASKNHLFAELFLRALRRWEGPLPSGPPTVRLRGFHARMADLLAANPNLAHAANVALLSADPDVERLRLRIGAEFMDRYVEALGEDHDPDVLETLQLAFSGALLQAGMGLIGYDGLADRLDRVVSVALGGTRR